MKTARIFSFVLISLGVAAVVPAAAQKPSGNPTQAQPAPVQTAARQALVLPSCDNGTRIALDSEGNADVCVGTRDYCTAGGATFTVDAKGNEDGPCTKKILVSSGPPGPPDPFEILDQDYDLESKTIGFDGNLADRVVRPGRDGYKFRRIPKCPMGSVLGLLSDAGSPRLALARLSGRDQCLPEPTCPAGMTLNPDVDGQKDMCFAYAMPTCAQPTIGVNEVLTDPCAPSKGNRGAGSAKCLALARGTSAYTDMCESWTPVSCTSPQVLAVRAGRDICGPPKTQWVTPSCPAGTQRREQASTDVCVSP